VWDSSRGSVAAWRANRISPSTPRGTLTSRSSGGSPTGDALENLAGGRKDDGHRRILVTGRLVHEDENPHDDPAVRAWT